MAIQIPVFALWIITSILGLNFQKNLKSNLNKEHSIHLYLLYAFFILHIISFFLSKNSVLAWSSLQPLLSILIIPALFLVSNPLYQKNYDKFLIAFVIGNIVALLFCTTDAFIHSTIIDNGDVIFKSSLVDKLNFLESFKIGKNHFSYVHFSDFKHPSYFSMYVVFSLGIIVYLIQNKKIKKYFGILLLGLVTSGIFFISSRAGIASGIIFFVYTSYIHFKAKSRFILKFSVSILLLIITSGILLSNTRMEKTMHIKEDAVHKETRLELWDASLYLVKDFFALGAGIGDIDEIRREKYLELGMIDASKNNLNSHNQYFESTLNGGILLLITLLLMLLIPFINSIKEKNYLLSLFILIISFNFLFESMLERFQGVFFIIFFYSLLIFIPKNKAEIIEIKPLKAPLP